jgi:hypothetical protein
MPEVIVLDAEQVHAFREKLQILLCLPYDRPDVQERVGTVVREMHDLIWENTYKTPTMPPATGLLRPEHMVSKFFRMLWCREGELNPQGPKPGGF